MKIKRKFCRRSDISWPTYILVVLFGLGSWVAVNGVWVELPLLVQHAPEFWKLPSIIAVVIQIANIGPILHTVINGIFPGKFRDVSVIYGILVVGIIACALLGFVWKKTGYIAGNERSIALIALIFFVSTVDCTSSVTFLPFMAAFPKDYMSALFVGGGLSALLPSLLAIAQGINTDGGTCWQNNTLNSSSSSNSWESDLNFGVNGFFFGLMFMMMVSLLAFFGINSLSFVKRERLLNSQPQGNGIPREAMALDRSQEFEMSNLDESRPNADENDDNSEMGDCRHIDHRFHVAFLLSVQMWIHALSNGVVPSIQSFACIPYGYKIYHLTLTLSNIANPLASLLFYWLPTKSILFVGLSTLVYTSLVGYILCAATLSTTPPLAEDNIGASIIITVSVISVALVTYTKVVISTWMQEKGERHLRLAGIALQTGSFFGALIIFFPVNVLNSFIQPSQC